MPSPIGHALAGVAVAWAVAPSADPTPSPRDASPDLVKTDDARCWRTLTWVCAALAALPDADLLTPWPHRTVTHSVTAVFYVFIITTIMTGQVTGRWRARIVLACTLAYASHLLLDWLAVDNNWPFGIELFWPFSDRWYISGWDIFLQTARPHLFSGDAIAVNTRAAIREVLVMGPIVTAIWLARRGRLQVAPFSTYRSRDRSFVQGARRPPYGGAADTDGTSDRRGRRGGR